MARWRVTPTWKKSLVEVQEWTKVGTDYVITHEIGWRSGEFILETEGDEPPVLEEGVDIFSTEYELSDWSTDDGCWEETDYDISDETEEERMGDFLAENSIYDLEGEGWVMSDCYMYINCEMDIEKVE